MNIPKSFTPPHPLYDNEIQQFLDMNNLKPNNIYSRDSEKEAIPNGKYYCVINLDSEENGGTHWTSLYVDGKKAYYYDAFGMPCPMEIIDWVKKESGKKLFYIDNQHQPNKSILCGYFACFFLYSMSNGMTLNKFMELFKNGGDETNDKQLLEYFNVGGKKKGKGFNLVEKLNKYLPNTEIHLRDVEFNDYGLPVGTKKHNFTGPNTNLKERIGNIDEMMDLPNMEDITADKIKYITPPIDDYIDKYASEHDLHYSWAEKHIKDKKKRLEYVHKADDILQKKAYDTMKNGKAPIQKRIQGALVSLTMYLKRKVGLGDVKNYEEYKFLDKHKGKLNNIHKEFFLTL